MDVSKSQNEGAFSTLICNAIIHLQSKHFIRYFPLSGISLKLQKPSLRKEGSKTATFRIDSQVLDYLNEESGQKRTSLNTLVSQILLSHAEFHTFASRAGMVSMPKTLLMRLMDRLSPKEVIELSEYVALNELKDTVLLMKTHYDETTLLQFIESWARAGGYPYRCVTKDHDGHSKTTSFVIQHDMGERWSLYFVELFKFAFEQLGTTISFQHTPSTIVFEVGALR